MPPAIYFLPVARFTSHLSNSILNMVFLKVPPFILFQYNCIQVQFIMGKLFVYTPIHSRIYRP
jgi:hypothetical protein